MVDDIAAFYGKTACLNPILYFIYYVVKLLVRLSTWVYYSKITVTGKRHDRSQNPCILISNHPSTLLDPLNVAVEVNAEVNFLANSTLFKHPVADWLLRRLYCIPIERPQDNGGKPLNNAENFRQAVRFLAKDGCLYIAPEGSSFVERRLRKLKTGTARIAFATEAANGWSVGLTLLPIGLNYSDPTKFRSRLVTVFGTPIRVADFRELYEADAVNAVHCLTEAVAEQLKTLILDCEDDAQDQLLYRVDAILRNEERLPSVEKLRRSQRVLGSLQQWKTEDAADYANFSALVFDYFERIKMLKINDLHVKNPAPGRKALLLAATFPLFLPSYLSHALPCFSTQKITKSLNADYHWLPTYKFAAGVVLYPLFIWLQTWFVGKMADWLGWPDWVKWAYLLAIVPMGLLAEWWLRTWTLAQRGSRAAYIAKNEAAIWEQLRGLRGQILDHCHKHFSI